MASSPTNAKAAARDTIDSLPEEATWEDILYGIYIRQKIEAGLRDIAKGDVLSDEEMREHFGIDE